MEETALYTRERPWVDPETHGTTPLHDQRLQAVCMALRDVGARRVIDLGCGAGALLLQLVQDDTYTALHGIDQSIAAVDAAGEQAGLRDAIAQGRLRLACASFLDPVRVNAPFDAAVLLETIEHVDPQRLSRVEHAVFGQLGTPTVIITTPNVAYNEVYGLPPGAFRHPDHQFEWTRAKFRAWAAGVAQRHGYTVRHTGIGPSDPALGAPTQMAVFTRAHAGATRADDAS